MTYVLLIYEARAEGEALPAAEEKAILPAHRALQAESAARGELFAAVQLGDKAAARTVRSRGGAHEVIDGPYMETKEWLVGFYLVECEDEATALERAKRICPSAYAVEVRPVSWRWKR